MPSRAKGFVFEVVVTLEPPSAVLADQIKSLDWRARGAVYKGRVKPAVFEDVKAKVKTLLQI